MTTFDYYSFIIIYISDEPCDQFQMLPGICRIPLSFTSVVTSPVKLVQLEEVTRGVCLRLCTNSYNMTCSSVMYNRRNSSCTLSAYTGEWLEAGASPCSESSGMEFYQRRRCICK